MTVSIEIENTFMGTKTEGDWRYNEYETTLIYGDNEMTVPFKMGLGLTREPEEGDVISSLLMDRMSYQNARDFEDFCNEFGYNSDSIKARNIYFQIEENTKELEELLGDDLPLFEKKYEDY